jgi:hypothetical protein
MPRIRTIKPEFFTSESLGRLSRDTRLAYVGLISQSDDSGRFRAGLTLLAGAIFPYDSDGLEVMRKALEDLSAAGKIVLYEVENCHFGAIVKWEHQRLDHPSPSKLPAPPASKLPRKVKQKLTRSPRVLKESHREDSGSHSVKTLAGSGIRDQGEDQGRDQGDPPRGKHAATVWSERGHPLQLKLEAEFASSRKHRYAHGGAKDTQALKRLMAVATDDEILTRWRRGLLAQVTEPTSVSTFTELGWKWNKLSARQSVLSDGQESIL